MHVWVLRLVPVLAGTLMLVGLFLFVKKHISESVAQLTVIILATNLLFLVVANTLTMIYCSPLGSPLVFYVLLTSPFLHGNLFYF